MSQLDSIVYYIENEFANINHQSSWDFSGKQIYFGNKTVNKVCFALDPSEQTIKQTIDRGCELLITHHPLFFTATKGIDTTKNKVVELALKHNITILSYHTNIDMAPQGINDYLIKLIGAKDEGLFIKEGEDNFFKLVVFVPAGHEVTILNAIDAAGGAVQGNYAKCAFMAKGTGTFIPLAGATPFIGKNGVQEYVDEIRIESMVLASKIEAVIKSVIKAHPYEEPAYDILPMKNSVPYGFGRIGNLNEATSFSNFAARLKAIFALNSIRVNMNEPDIKFSRFAISSGSGASLWKEAVKKELSVLVTGDMKHHDALDAKSSGVCIFDIGHYASEQIYMKYFAEIIKKKFNIETFVVEESPSIFEW